MGTVRETNGTSLSITAGTTLAASTELDFSQWAVGLFKVQGGDETVTWYGCQTKDGTYLPIATSAGANKTTALKLDKWMKNPDEVFPARFIKLVASTTQRTVDVMVKT